MKRMLVSPPARWDDNEIDQLVAAANPVDASVLARVSAQSLAELRDHMAGERMPTPACQRRRAVILLVAVALMVGGTTAAAGWVGVHSGWFGPPGMTESDTSEFLRQDSPEIVAVIDRLTHKYSLPPEGSWSRFKRHWPLKERAYIQVTGLEGGVADEASCQWQQSWLDGTAAQDPARAMAAQQVLDQVPSWPIRAKIDGGNLRQHLRNMAALAHAGNVTEFSRLHGLNCPAGSPRG
jgi:hypothetical protein